MIELQAIVLKTFPLFEKDLVVECFSLEAGRIRIYAKYAQSKKPRFGGLLQTLNLLKIGVFKRKDSYYLQQVSLIHDYTWIKSSYEKMSAVFFLASVIRQITEFDQENEALFEIYLDFLNQLNHDGKLELNQIKLATYKQIIEFEGIASSAEINNLTERKFVNMIESYTNTKIKDIS